ncbi:fetuin-B-like [Pelodytes ibericus]
MKLAILLLVCTQVVFSKRNQPQPQGQELTSVACNAPVAEAVADLALQQLNANRKIGSVYGLKRITNVQEQFEEESGFVYYLTVDVVETECHVLSRQDWKECEPKPEKEAEFGQCKITFHLHKTQRIAQLYNYFCNVRPAAQSPEGCPGCPIYLPLNDSSFQNVANQAIEKFNKENKYDKYFSIGNITKATARVIAGTAYHVEFTIQESSCNKSIPAEQVALCQPLDCEFAHSGYCKSRSLELTRKPNEPFLSVTCKVFEPEAAVAEEQKHQSGNQEQKPEGRPGKRQHGKKEEKRGKKHGKSDSKPGHEHGGSHEHDHQHLHPYEHHHSEGGHGPPSESVKPVGTITYGDADENQDKKGNKKSDGSKSKQEKRKESRGKRSTPANRRGPGRPTIRSFPAVASTSDQCPGEVKNYFAIKESTQAPLLPAK